MKDLIVNWVRQYIFYQRSSHSLCHQLNILQLGFDVNIKGIFWARAETSFTSYICNAISKPRHFSVKEAVPVIISAVIRRAVWDVGKFSQDSTNVFSLKSIHLTQCLRFQNIPIGPYFLLEDFFNRLLITCRDHLFLSQQQFTQKLIWLFFLFFYNKEFLSRDWSFPRPTSPDE